MFGIITQVAGPIASSSFGLITFVHDKVEKSFSQQTSKITPGIVPLEDFSIRWPYMLLYSTLLYIGLNEFCGLITSLLVKALALSMPNVPQDFVLKLVSVMSLPLVSAGVFFLARWMGIRSGKAAYWLLPVCLVVGRIVELAIASFFMSSFRQTMVGMFRQVHGVWVLGIAVAFVLLSGLGMLGVWVGNRVRFAAYFNSLLKQVSPATRDTLLAMTFEESKAASRNVTAASGTA
jgi:hypothetical protein